MLHSPCPMVVTLHDLAALKRRSEHLRTGVRLRLRQLAVQRADARDRAHRGGRRRRGRAPRPRARAVVVIPEAPDSVMYPRPPHEIAEARARFALPERYLVWVGGLQHPDPRKHVAELAATPRELPLVLVGPTRPWAHELPDVTLTGHVSDEHLAAIYSGAHALVIPSEDEGFGLPAVEALACGTPVVACEMPALREVLDERATFVEPGDLEALILAAEAAQPPGAAAARVDAGRTPRAPPGASTSRPWTGRMAPRSARKRAAPRPTSAVSRRRAASARPGSSSAGSSDRAPATSARGR